MALQITTQPSLEMSSPAGTVESYDDDDDVGAKTIPAAMLPNGLFVAPSELNGGGGRRPNTLPPPVASPMPPPPPLSALQRESGETASMPNKPSTSNGGWETYDDDDDDAGMKTTIARPFDDARKPRLPLYIGIGIGVGLLVLFGLLFALETGPVATAPTTSDVPELKHAKDDAALDGPKPQEKAAAPVDAKPPEPLAAKETKEPVKIAASDIVKAAPAPPEPRVVPPEPEHDREPPPRAPEPEARTVETPKEAKAHPTKTHPTRSPRSRKPKPDEEDTAAAEPSPPQAATAQTGLLTLVMEPGLLVTLNGQDLGSTPLFNKVVPIGRQAFKVFSSNGEARTLVLDIKPGQVNSARQDFNELK